MNLDCNVVVLLLDEVGKMETVETENQMYITSLSVNYGMAGKINELMDTFRNAGGQEKQSGKCIPFNPGKTRKI
jgi:hypothetical protein